MVDIFPNAILAMLLAQGLRCFMVGKKRGEIRGRWAGVVCTFPNKMSRTRSFAEAKPMQKICKCMQQFPRPDAILWHQLLCPGRTRETQINLCHCSKQSERREGRKNSNKPEGKLRKFSNCMPSGTHENWVEFFLIIFRYAYIGNFIWMGEVCLWVNAERRKMSG